MNSSGVGLAGDVETSKDILSGWPVGLAFVVALAATICVASMSHAQSGQPKAFGAILPDVALLIQGPFGEYSYKLTRTADDSVTLEELVVNTCV